MSTQNLNLAISLASILLSAYQTGDLGYLASFHRLAQEADPAVLGRAYDLYSVLKMR